MALVSLKEHLSSLWTTSRQKRSCRGQKGMNEPLLSGTSSIRSYDEEQGMAYSAIPRAIPPDDDAESESGKRSRVNPRTISDAILGLSDGLTVPFALSAGLSAFGNTRVVVLGSLAELVAGAISMGLGGYVGAKSEVESYETIERETQELMHSSPSETMAIVREVFAPFKIPEAAVTETSTALRDSPDRLKEFLLTFHHKQTEPNSNQAWISAITLALGYFIGGFIPLIPYFCVDKVILALYYSICVMGVTLMFFGYVKTCIVRGWSGRENVIAGIKGGLQMVVVGGLAAGAAIGLVRAIDHAGGS